MKLRKFSPSRLSSQSGFTLMEIMMVVAIIAMLAGLAIWKLAPTLVTAEISKARADMNSLKIALVVYRTGAGYPTSSQGLDALVKAPEPRPPSWRQAALEGGAVPKDPWGQDYIYVIPGKKYPGSYDLYSAGPDQKPGTDDDVWSN